MNLKRLRQQLALVNLASVSLGLVLTAGTIMWELRLSWTERFVGAVITIGAVTLGFILHLVLVRPLLPDERVASPIVALRALRSFPIRSAKLSWQLWVILGVVVCAGFYAVFGTWQSDDIMIGVTLVLFLAGLLGGGLAFLTQFYLYKMLLMPIVRRVAADAVATGHGQELFDVPLYGLRNKLLVPSLTLICGALVFSTVFGFTHTAERMQSRLLSHASQVLAALRPSIEGLIESGSLGEAAARLARTRLGAGGQIFLLDSEGREVSGLQRLPASAGELLAPGRFDWRSRFVTQVLPAAEGRYQMLAVFPWRLSDGAIHDAGIAFASLFVVATLTIFVIATFAARDIVTPVKDIVYRAERIARGDLADSVVILTEDELGEFSWDLEQVRRYLAGVLRDIQTASEQLETLSQKVLTTAQIVEVASAEQTSHVRSGLVAIERMQRGFDRIATSGASLALQAQDCSAAIEQLDAAVREVDRSVEVAVDLVTMVHGAIDRFHRVSELIFASLDDLRRSIDITVRNIRKFSDSIRRNEERVGMAGGVAARMHESSREGAELTSLTVNSIALIEDSVTRTAATIATLVAQLNQISALVGVIDEVADDTKLLSLNAAIIAAQAGENGRSFSVLAEKIKILADRTNAATSQIIAMIGRVSEGSRQLSDGIERVRQSVRETRDAAGVASSHLGKIMQAAQLGATGMIKVAQISARHVDDGETIEREVVALAAVVNEIHDVVRAQLSRAKDIDETMSRVESGARTVKSMSRVQAERGRNLSASIEQVVTMVSHLSRILQEQQAEVRRIGEAMKAIESGAGANQVVSARLRREVEELQLEVQTFHQFIERFRSA